MIPLLFATTVSAATLGDVPAKASTALLSLYDGSNQTFLEVTLPDGEQGLFLLDTGAGISAISASTAERLGLQVDQANGTISGLGGTTPYYEAMLPKLSVAGVNIHDVEMAVGVPGVPTFMNGLEVDGILGNNVWSLFTLEIDYPANELRLHRPDTYTLPKDAAKLSFDGQHVFSMGTLRLHDTNAASQPIKTMLQIDTGAGELLISGDLPATGPNLVFTEGLEPVYGLGAASIIPPSEFVIKTRRIALDSVFIGGAHVEMQEQDVRWVNFKGARNKRLDSVRALAGHALLKEHCIVLDFKNEQIALEKSRKRARPNNAHTLALTRELSLHENKPERGLIRATLHTALSRRTKDSAKHLLAANTSLKSFIEVTEDLDAVDLAKLQLADNLRSLGQPSQALSVARQVPPERLAQSGKFLETIHALTNSGAFDEAIRVANMMANTIDDKTPVRTQSYLYVARADAYTANGDYTQAQQDLISAASLLQNPDAFLMRRARVAWLAKDFAGTNANLRRMLEAFPSKAETLWLYRLVNEAMSEPRLIKSDIQRAIQRVQPAVAGLDFQAAALSWLSEPNKTRMNRGIKRDCLPAKIRSARDNCIGWYYTMSGTRMLQARWRINRTLRAEPHRPDYLDTLAVHQYMKGDFETSSATAARAVNLDPGNVYMLWQKELFQKAASR